jgi:Stretch-activated Ca2+-permeable channel component
VAYASGRACSAASRDVQLWTCDDCLRSYKAWLCASLFPRCVGAAVDNGVTKPCLELCWTVSRR